MAITKIKSFGYKAQYSFLKPSCWIFSTSSSSPTCRSFMAAAQVHQQLENAVNFEGSSEEKKAKALLATLGIDYDAITMEQFINLIDVLKLSKHMNSPISQRGKTTMTHGKGKRKKR